MHQHIIVRVAIALATLALVITMVFLGVSALYIGNLSKYISANIYQTSNGYYLVFTIHNPLPLPVMITITQGSLSKSIYVEPYGFGNITMPLQSPGAPINVTVAIPGIASVSSMVTSS